MESDSDVRDVGYVFLKIAKAFGITNVPDDDHLRALFQFVKRNYPNFTQEEIMYAFELYATGKLDCTKQHYQTMNFEFVAAVLMAYGRKRFDEIKKYEATPREPVKQLTAHEKTDVEFQEFMFNLLKKYCDDNGKMPVVGDWEAAFLHMERAQLITMTNEEKAEYVEVVKQRERDRIFAGNQLLNITDALELKSLDDMRVLKMLCRQERAKDYFRMYLKQNQI